MVSIVFNLKYVSQPKLGLIGHVEDVLKTSGPADSKSVPDFDN